KKNAEALQAYRVHVLDDVDAEHLEKEFRSHKFDTIIFKFPNVGSRVPLHKHNPNYILLRKFLRSAAAIINPSGKVIISTVDSPHYEGAFQFEDAAEFAGFNAPESYPFDPLAFPEYSHANTKNDESAI